MRALASLILLVAATGALGADRPCSSLGITADDQPVGRIRADYSVRQIMDLKLWGSFPAQVKPDPNEVVHAVLTTPNGYRYQQVDVPVAAPSSAPSTRALAGYPFPVKTRPLVSSKDGTGGMVETVTVSVPVGGTTIVENGLYGTWRAEVRMDAGKPCTATFILRP